MMKTYLGIDCGATHLRIGLVDETANLLDSQVTNSPLKNNPQDFGLEVKKIINQKGWKDFESCGVGTPGPIDIKLGTILPSANLKNDQPIEIVKQLKTVLDINTYFDRDTNLALLGESWIGAAKDFKDVVMLTLGSGVGGAIMIDGKIDRGQTGKAGEIGHMYIEIQNSTRQPADKTQNLPRCGLGHEGCLEAMVNGANDLDEMATYLGYGLANIVDILSPELIIIGGGKLKMGDFLPKAIEVMQERSIKPSVDAVFVRYAKLDDMSGVYGAAYFCIINSKAN